MSNGEQIPIVNWSSTEKESIRGAQCDGDGSAPVFLVECCFVLPSSVVHATATQVLMLSKMRKPYRDG